MGGAVSPPVSEMEQVMEAITIGQAQKLTSPNPFALLTVLTPDGRTNVMALSWWTYASNHPATVVACLSQKGYSGGCITASGGFGLSVVGEALAAPAARAGGCSGRSVDKAAELGIPLFQPEYFLQPVIEGSRVCFSCRLKDTLNVGDHVLYVGEVEAVLGDSSVEALFAMDGYAHLASLSGEGKAAEGSVRPEE